MRAGRRRWVWTGAGILLAALVVWQAGRLATGNALMRGQGQAETALRLTENALAGYLARYQAVPELLAQLDTVRDLAMNPDDPDRRRRIDALLAARNRTLGSSDIYIMRRDGETIAASNHARVDSFVGQNFNYRPYFTGALRGQTAQFFGVGTTSGVRGFYFAAPIRDGLGQVAGVIAVKIALDQVEASWRGGDLRIFVTDPDGVVFMASRPDWLYRAILPPAQDLRAADDPTRRYPDIDIRPLYQQQTRADGVTLARIQEDGGTNEYVAVQRVMADAGWTVHVLQDSAGLRAQARLIVALLVLVFCVAGSGALILAQRRARAAERLAMQVHATAELERRVAERTADLGRMNHRLAQEITERRATEVQLRAAQDNLVQVGKLAALGQMSASLSHEINQPLAAARNYTDSAAILLDRGDAASARANITQIMALLDRISAIGKHLRNAARKPGDRLGPVALAPLLVETQMIMGVRLTAVGATLELDVPEGLPPLLAGPTRLQQVLVNLIGNAVDAVEGGPDLRITLTARAAGDSVTITLRDRGPGVPDAIAARIFDPFFTTKPQGAGLGLGLSISATIIRDLGGLITCHDAGPGALFRVRLPIAGAARAAA